MTYSVMYVESYGVGSHRRMTDLLNAHSRHELRFVMIGAEHWRWRYAAAHHELADCINALADGGYRPDFIVLSGPMNVGALVGLLHPDLHDVPRVTYFHESQWTYPTREIDIRHHLVSHLDAVRNCQAAWFNSEYHRSVFIDEALNNRSERVRELAHRVLPPRVPDTAVLYPPVSVDDETMTRRSELGKTRIAWAARWEAEKRPELFTEAMLELAKRRDDFELVLLSPGRIPDPRTDDLLRRLEQLIAVQGPLESRADYLRALSGCSIFVSTADHEFFGMAAIEAAMLGAIPVVPNALAYPEALPSAWFYRQHDIPHFVHVLESVLDTCPSSLPVQTDAVRFEPNRTVAEFDAAIDRAVRKGTG